jgi:hypothetical protein
MNNKREMRMRLPPGRGSIFTYCGPAALTTASRSPTGPRAPSENPVTLCLQALY